jgi:predicted nucleic-acid-binding Zn-ribbon protein
MEQKETIQINENKYTIISCKECNGRFWTIKSYMLHWSCKNKVRCGYCFNYGHSITNCDVRFEPMDSFIK